MQIIHKDVKSLTPIEYKACYLANYRRDGLMQEVLSDCRLGNLSGKVIMLWDGPASVSSLLGWTLLTKPQRFGPLAVSSYICKKSKYTAQFWVKRPYRRRGYAKILMNEVKKVDLLPNVIPHNLASSELFSSYRVTTSRYDRAWIKQKQKIA